MTLFERIKSLAVKKDKNVKEVALELGFSENLFYKWKNSEPKARDLEKVADYFDVSVDYLLGRDTQPKRKLGAKGELIATHVDDDVSEEDMNDILKYIEFRKNNPL